MASKTECGDDSISETKMSRVKVLEQRLFSEGSDKSPAALPARSAASRVFTRHSRSQDSEANDPIYNLLCQPIHENLLGFNSQSHEERVGGDTIKGILHDIFRSGDDASNYMRGTTDTNLQDKFVHLENHVIQGNASAKARLRALRSRGKRSQKHMSMRQHRQCGSFDFPRKYQRYDMFLPMHEMWKEYIGELLRNCRKRSIEQCLLVADFHGAILAVVESKNKTFIGVQGIMVRETTNTFGILTSENKFRVVPKKGSVFIFQFDFWRVTLYGDKLPSRKLNQADS